jgi:hypothetical protein
MLAKMCHLGIIVGAGNDLDVWIGGACLMHDLTSFKGFWDGNQKKPRSCQIGRLKHAGVSSITQQHFNVAVAQGLNRCIARLDDQQPPAAAEQAICNPAANSATPDQHGMIVQ